MSRQSVLHRLRHLATESPSTKSLGDYGNRLALRRLPYTLVEKEVIFLKSLPRDLPPPESQEFEYTCVLITFGKVKYNVDTNQLRRRSLSN